MDECKSTNKTKVQRSNTQSRITTCGQQQKEETLEGTATCNYYKTSLYKLNKNVKSALGFWLTADMDGRIEAPSPNETTTSSESHIIISVTVSDSVSDGQWTPPQDWAQEALSLSPGEGGVKKGRRILPCDAKESTQHQPISTTAVDLLSLF